MKYSFNFSGLLDIPFQKYDKDFTFIVDGKRYQTARIIADILSPKVRKLHFIDSSITEFNLDTSNMLDPKEKESDEKDYFNNFLHILTTEEIILDIIEQKRYSTYFYKMGNINEYLRIHPEFLSPLSIENAIDRLLSIESLTINNSDEIDHQNINISEIVSFIAIHFSEFPKEIIKRLSTEFLNAIIQSENLLILDEDSLLELLIDLYEEDHRKSELFSGVLFKNVSETSLERFTKTIDFDDMNSTVWRSICERLFPTDKLTQKVDKRYIKKKVEPKEFKPESGHEFEGIMQHLTQKTGGNIHENGTIEITSNSIYYNNHPKNLVDYQNGSSFYWSDDVKDVFVCFDFKDKRVQLSNYSIKSFVNHQNNHHLRNWTIEVSNDGRNWEEVDRHSEDMTLNGPSKQCTFKVSTERNKFYRFVRLHQTGYSWCNYPNSNHYHIQVVSIEFFGILDENQYQ